MSELNTQNPRFPAQGSGSTARGMLDRPAREQSATTARVLVVDDDRSVGEELRGALSNWGYEVALVHSAEQALHVLNSIEIGVALVDVAMSMLTGMDLLQTVKKGHPEVEVVMMAGQGDIPAAVRAVKHGAYNFLTKPFRSTDTVVMAVTNAAQHRLLLGRMKQLERAIEHAVVMTAGDAIGDCDLLARRSPVEQAGETSTSSSCTRDALVLPTDLVQRPFTEARRCVLQQFERSYADALLERTGGNISEAARQSGLDRSNFRRILKKHRRPASRADSAQPQVPSPAERSAELQRTDPVRDR